MRILPPPPSERFKAVPGGLYAMAGGRPERLVGAAGGIVFFMVLFTSYSYTEAQGEIT